MPTGTTYTEAEWNAWLDAFAEGKTIAAACKATGIGRRTFYDHRDREPAFEAAFREVDEEITDALEREAIRRAQDGTDRPVFQGGKEVGTVREYSNDLLIRLLMARRPAQYANKIDVNDQRDERQRREIERMSEDEVRAELTGLDDNVIELNPGSEEVA